MNAEVGSNIFKQTIGNGSVNETNNYGPFFFGVLFNNAGNCYDYIVLIFNEWYVDMEHWWNDSDRKTDVLLKKTSPSTNPPTMNPTSTATAMDLITTVMLRFEY